jgi:hypothetical protein
VHTHIQMMNCDLRNLARGIDPHRRKASGGASLKHARPRGVKKIRSRQTRKGVDWVGSRYERESNDSGDGHRSGDEAIRVRRGRPHEDFFADDPHYRAPKPARRNPVRPALADPVPSMPVHTLESKWVLEQASKREEMARLLVTPPLPPTQPREREGRTGPGAGSGSGSGSREREGKRPRSRSREREVGSLNAARPPLPSDDRGSGRVQNTTLPQTETRPVTREGPLPVPVVRCALCEVTPTVEQEKNIYETMALYELAKFGSICDSALFGNMVDFYNEAMRKVPRVTGFDALRTPDDPLSEVGAFLPLTADALDLHYNGRGQFPPHVITERRRAQEVADLTFASYKELRTQTKVYEMKPLGPDDEAGVPTAVPIFNADMERHLERMANLYFKSIKVAAEFRYKDAGFVAHGIAPRGVHTTLGLEGDSIKPNAAVRVAASASDNILELTSELGMFRRAPVDLF